MGTASILGQEKRTPTWTHTFICLASPKQEYAPDSSGRATLKIAGFGEEMCVLICLMKPAK